MFERTRIWLSRATLPAFLLSLAALCATFAEVSSNWGCALYKMRNWRRYGDPVGPAAAEQLDFMVTRAEGVFETAWREQRSVFLLLSIFAVAYLLFARERLPVRVSVLAGVLFLTLVPPIFGSVC